MGFPIDLKPIWAVITQKVSTGFRCGNHRNDRDANSRNGCVMGIPITQTGVPLSRNYVAYKFFRNHCHNECG
jgi:hypothetical protein